MWRSVARAFRFAAIAILSFVAAGYLLLCGLVVLTGGVFVASGGGPVMPAQAGLGDFTAVEVKTDDGERLSGWWKLSLPDHGAILLLIGNGGVQLSDYAEILAELSAHGFGVLGIEYRGNKGSTGRQSEAGVYADARAGFDFIRRAAPRAKIAAFGQSFGTGVAVELARERPVSGLLLESAYASVLRLFERADGIPLPFGLLIGNPLNSEAHIEDVHVPVMIMHGTADKQIPIEEARRLYATAHQPKTMIEIEGAGHGGGWQGGRERALQALAEWTAPDSTDPAPAGAR